MGRRREQLPKSHSIVSMFVGAISFRLFVHYVPRKLPNRTVNSYRICNAIIAVTNINGNDSNNSSSDDNALQAHQHHAITRAETYLKLQLILELI